LDLKSQDKLRKLHNLVIFDHPNEIHVALATQVGVEIFSFHDLVNEGSKLLDYPKQEPNPDSILILGVTSGTTGEPKQAMLTHLNFISGQVCEDFLGFNFREDDVYLSYVPLTHVYEQIMHIDAIMFGFRIGYSSGDVKNLINDI
jgi:long-chain acyl-CoA synthetase